MPKQALKSRPWVIFDADNTLWHLEPLYDEARKQACSYIQKVCDPDIQNIESFQRERDKELNEVYGYSSARFARSFEDAFYHFHPAATSEQVRHVRAIAEQVFTQKAEIVEDAELVLKSLYDAGFHLGLLTAGEAWVQQKRISEFHLQGIFHAIEVVEKKTSEEFSQFCKKHSVDPASCWVIGDSKSSDIEPSIKAGLKAILVPHDNWAPIEDASDIQARHYTQVQQLRDVLPILSAPEFDFSPEFRPGIACYGIFEGGGARGLAHVGALKACEERKVRFAGVAGTSAGSIIAGLIAVGYQADELFNIVDDDQSGLLDRNYIPLLGEQEWNRAIESVEKIEKYAGLLASQQRESRIDDIPVLGPLRRLWNKSRAGYYWLRVGFALKPVRSVSRDLGYFSTMGFRNWYNSILAHKLGKNADYVVRFSDVDFDLRIISADINSSKMVEHSKLRCPSRSIAEAVSASIAIPVVFKPEKISDDGRKEMHVDGGMLSNFPAWVFSESQDARPVLGFELVERETLLSDEPDLFTFLRALLATAISGKRGLEIRGISNLHVATIPVSIGTFQFRTSDDNRRRTYLEGLMATRHFFPAVRQLVTQEQMAPFLYKAHQLILEEVGRSVHLRVNVMDKNSLNRLAIRYHYNMDFDSDDRMELPLDAGGAGQCYDRKTPILVDLYRARREFPNFRMSKYEQALVRSSLKTLLSVPIFDSKTEGELADRPIIGVLNFDSDDLSTEDMGALDGVAMDASVMISYVWQELAEKGGIS